MRLPARLLDDATFDSLQRQLRQRLPALTPEWTDWNPSDPGIALLDLVAYAAEGLLFRFNQIPEATQLAFLRLLDIPLRPASAARVLLAFSSKHKDGKVETLAQDTVARAGDIGFAVERETPVWPGEALALIRRNTAAPATNEVELAESVKPMLAALGRRYAAAGSKDLAAVAVAQAAYYDVVYVDGSAAVDPKDAVDQSVWIAWLAPEPFEAPAVPKKLPPDWRKGSRIALGWWPAALPDDDANDPLAALTRAEPCPGLGAPKPVRTSEWRILANALVDGKADWRPIAVVADDTDGGTRPGVVHLELPDDPVKFLPPLVADDLQGTEDFPPPLPPDLAARVVCWLRAFATPAASGARQRVLPAVQRVAGNVASAVQALPRGAEYLGRGDGQPAQRFALGAGPVLSDAQAFPIVLEVEENEVWVAWQQVDTLDLSTRDDRHFMVDGQAGEIRFGPRGPQLNERVRVRGYRVGGGAAGNVGARAIDRCDNTQVEVVNPLPAGGGRDVEALAAALDRIPAEVSRRDRAVTAEDFRALAEATPGAEIARAEVLPLFDPRTRNDDRAGAVSVIVWAASDPEHPDAPRPDASQRAAVCAWLDERRLVGTELFVLAPTYRRVAVACSIATEPGFGPEAARALTAQILRRYLAPLPPDGPTGRGWPLGRAVRDRELIAAVLQIDGVEYVERLRLAGWDDAQGKLVEQETVALKPWEVAELVAVQVVDATQPLPAPDSIVPPPPAPGPVVPVPLIRDMC